MFSTSRSRMRDQTSTTYLQFIDTRYPDSFTPVSFRGSSELINDNSTKGFREISARGGLVFSDCEIKRMSRTLVDGHWIRSGYVTGLLQQKGDLVGVIKDVDPNKAKRPKVTSTLASTNVLLTRAYARMNSSAILGGEILGTLGQTISTIRRPFKSAQKLLHDMQKYRLKRLGKTAESAARATADTWLEYRYGWRPVILDCQQVIKDSNDVRLKTDRMRSVARAGDAATVNYSNSWPSTSPLYFSGYYTSETKLKCNAGVVYEKVNRTPTKGIGEYFGLTARDIPATAWELVPYSFVVDWFFNVGEWLQAVTPNPDIQVLGNWVTTIVETKTTAGGTRHNNGDGWSGSCGSEVFESFSFIRETNRSITNTTPELTGSVLSVLRQADAAALLLKPILGTLKKNWKH